MNKLFQKMLILAVLAAALSSAPVLAEDIYWDNSAGGAFNAAGNWSPNQVPTSSDNVYFTNAANYTVITPITAHTRSSNATFNATSGTITWDTGAPVDYIAWTVYSGNDSCVTVGANSGSGPTVVFTTETKGYLDAMRFIMGPEEGSHGTVIVTNGFRLLVQSDWKMSEFYVGLNGGGNVLKVLGSNAVNGSQLRVGRGFRMGEEVTSTNNLAVISGPGAFLSVGTKSTAGTFIGIKRGGATPW